MDNYFLEKDERVLWKGKPNKLVYTIGGFGFLFILGFVAVWTTLVLQSMDFTSTFDYGFSSSQDAGFSVFGIFPYLMLIFPIFFLGYIIYRLISASKVEYIITDNRVYIISGLVGTDVNSLEYREIEKLNVNVNLLEKLANVGTVALTPDQVSGYGENRHTIPGIKLIGIEKPYEVYKLIKDIKLDVYTDQQYPNDLRPKTNKGYKTKLDR